MITKIFKNKWFLAMVALIISVVLWAYVVINTNPTYTSTLTVETVENIGLAELTENGLYFSGSAPTSVEIRASGPRKLVTGTAEDYLATIDYSQIKGAGEYTLKVKVAAPSGVEVHRTRPGKITINVEEGKSKQIGVDLEITGENKSEFDISLENKEITVSGPGSKLSNVKKIKVAINTDDITKTGQLVYQAVALDASGNEMTDESITYEHSVKVNALYAKNVKVTVDKGNIPRNITSLYDVKITPSKETVKITGDADKIKDIESVEADISSVTLNTSENTQTVDVSLKLPKDVSLAKDEKEKIQVTFEYKAKQEEKEPEKHESEKQEEKDEN